MKRALRLGAALARCDRSRSRSAAAQPRRRAQRRKRRAASAPIDLTGYWVAVVSEDWRHRMATPRKGDFESLPLNAEGRRVANAWDLDGRQRGGHAMQGVRRRRHHAPARPAAHHVGRRRHAEDRVRCRHADAAARASARRRRRRARRPGKGSRAPSGSARRAVTQGPVRAQIGNSTGPIAPGGGGRGQRGGPPPSGSLTEGGALKVVTTDFRAGYLRKNGVPYSESATITEYFHRLPEHRAATLAARADDRRGPAVLERAVLTSTHFKREPNGSKWKPTECRTAPPPPPPAPSADEAHVRGQTAFAARAVRRLVRRPQAPTSPREEQGRLERAARGRGREARRGAGAALSPTTATRCSSIFQALDAAGKDGTIRHVFAGVNPAGLHVTSFKQPTHHELEHDFLWRTTPRLPERGNDRDLQSQLLRGSARRARAPRVSRGAAASRAAVARRLWEDRCARSPTTSGISPSRAP